MTDHYWRDHAACRNAKPELFDFLQDDDRQGGKEPAQLRHIRLLEALGHCDGCPVASTCLMEAVATLDSGVRGGELIEHGRVMPRPRPGSRRGVETKPLQPCGTVAAYKRHSRAGEPLDEACRAAMRDHNAKRHLPIDQMLVDTVIEGRTKLPPKKYPREREAIVRALAARGMSDSQIGEWIGSSRIAVAAVRKTRHIPAGQPQHRPPSTPVSSLDQGATVAA